MLESTIAKTTEAEAAKLCTHKLGDGTICAKPAAFAFTWAWGESGKCCPECQFLLNQVAGQIERAIGFTPLDAGVAPPIERDERIAHHAKVLALEDELAVARKRGLELYDTNTKLAEEGRILMARNNDSRERIEALVKRVDDLETRNGQLLANNADQHEELERLRAFLPSDDHG